MFSFGRLELDEPSRSFRLNGEERTLQPLVFDLLVYLVSHRDRVVPKEELLDKLWAGTIVADGSLQRVVSLLRTTLREVEMQDCIRTFARRGYRFCPELGPAEGADETPEPALSEAQASSELQLQAREFVEKGQWDGALAIFESSKGTLRLTPEDCEAWGNAAMFCGRPEQAVGPLEQAVLGFELAAQNESAARAAITLCNVKLEGMELPIAKGWLSRARAYLKDIPEGKQHGLSQWLSSRIALFEGELDECLARASLAREIAERIGDADLHSLGLIYQGHILIAQGDTRHGLHLHDEAGAAALTGRLGPWVSGIVFCSVIWAYLHLGDHHRAGQWTDEFSRWCDRNAAFCYPAICRLHRSEVLAMRGELATAEAEAQRARQQLAVAGPFVEGDAHRILGEIRLSLGDLDAAERAFRQAHRLGWNPQPGLSLLLASRGDATGAIKQLERSLTQPTWTDGQRRGTMLAVLARLAAQNGQVERAIGALTELTSSPELCASRACKAESARARGELCWAQNDFDTAELSYRESIAIWLESGAPVHAAHVRLRLAELLLLTADATGADLELCAAEATFQDVQALALLNNCTRLRASITT